MTIRMLSNSPTPAVRTAISPAERESQMTTRVKSNRAEVPLTIVVKNIVPNAITAPVSTAINNSGAGGRFALIPPIFPIRY